MNPTCQRELFIVDGDIIEKAHIRPYSEDADNSFENLVMVCPSCHKEFDKIHLYSVEQVTEQKVMLENMKMEQKEKENILNGINRIYQAQVENAIKELEVETGISLKDGEERGVVTQSFEKTNALIDKGLQIYAAIDSPKEVQVLFEPLENNYSLIEQGIKLLEKKHLKNKYIIEY